MQQQPFKPSTWDTIWVLCIQDIHTQKEILWISRKWAVSSEQSTVNNMFARYENGANLKTKWKFSSILKHFEFESVILDVFFPALELQWFKITTQINCWMHSCKQNKKPCNAQAASCIVPIHLLRFLLLLFDFRLRRVFWIRNGALNSMLMQFE